MKSLCGIAVVREQSIPVQNRVHKNNSTILYYVNGELCEAAVGTIDHLLRVADGGGNQSDNLVISCAPCNIERDRQMGRYNQPFARRRVPCRNCGGRFFQIDWGCCSICGAGPRQISETSKIVNLKRHARLMLKIALYDQNNSSNY